jgi:hypothetical protein
MPDDAPAAPAKKPRFRLTRGRIIALAIVGVLLATAIGLYVFLTTPPRLDAYEDSVPVESRSDNTNLYATLVAAGYDAPLVDVTGDRAYVAYELPFKTQVDGASGNVTATTDRRDADLAQRFVLGAAGAVASTAAKVVAVQHVDGVAKLVWEASMSDIQSFLHGTLGEADFEAKIAKRTL